MDGKTDGRTDRGKTVYPHPLRWSGGITTFISHKINKNKNPDDIHTGFAPGYVDYKKGCTRLADASDKVYQLLAHGRWFSPGTSLPPPLKLVAMI